MAETFVRLTDPFGQNGIDVKEFLDIDGPGLEYVLSCGKVGAATMTLPPSLNERLLPRDARMYIMRSVGGLPPKREGDAAFLIRKWEYDRDYTKVTALHANCLLGRRIAAYRETDTDPFDGLPFTKKNHVSSDHIKVVVRDNLGDLVNTTFRLGDQTRTDIRPYLTTAPLDGTGIPIQSDFALQNIADAVGDVAGAAQQQQTLLTILSRWMLVEVVAIDEQTLEVRTFPGWRGQDHSPSSGDSVIFSESRGNLERAKVTIDAIDEVTFVLAAGTGTGAARVYGSAIALPGDTPFDRIERLIEVNTDDANALDNAAKAELRARRPVMTLTADLVDTEKAIRGIDFDYGDLVGIDHPRWPSDIARLDIVKVSWQGGKESTKIQFRAL